MEQKVETTLLLHIRDGLEAGMIEALLKEAGIPVMRKYPGTGQLLHMVMGTSLYGTELHVPEERLEEARGLVASITRGTDPAGMEMAEPWQEQERSPAEISRDVSLRPMALSDWPALEALWTRTPGIGLRYPDDTAEGLARYLLRNPTSSFVADMGGEIVGSVLAGHDGRRGYLYHVAVSPDNRRRGIGRALVMSALDALRAEGIQKAGLVVFQQNEQANPFWEALGWTHRNDLMYRDHSLAEEEQ